MAPSSILRKTAYLLTRSQRELLYAANNLSAGHALRPNTPSKLLAAFRQLQIYMKRFACNGHHLTRELLSLNVSAGRKILKRWAGAGSRQDWKDR
jgi:hypothetical protein